MTTQRWVEMVGAYVLDALDADERPAFEARLAVDPELHRLVDEARASTLVLAESLPDVEPPAHLRGEILERAHATKRIGEAPAGARSAEGERKRGPAPQGAPAPRRRRSSPVGRAVPWVLLAASFAGLFWLTDRNTGLRQESTRLAAQLDSVRASLGTAQAALARFDSLALALSGPNVQLAVLTGDTDPTLRLVWNRDQELLLVAAENLPPLAAGRTFQLWGLRGDEAPVSLGIFDADDSGDALLTLPVGATESYDLSAITDEPAGGSPQPTTQPFLVGAWTAA